MPIHAGTLTQPATLQARSDNVGTSGGSDPVWADVGMVWLGFGATSGSEGPSGGHAEATSRVMLKMRYRPGVKATMRLVFKDGFEDRTLDIEHVEDVHMRHEELQLTCREVVT